MSENNWLGPPEGPYVAVDEPTRRLGLYLAIGFAVQFVAHLLGIGVHGGIRVELLHPLFFAAALFLRQGRPWARSVFVVVGVLAALAAVVLTLLSLAHPETLVFTLLLDGLVVVYLAAVSFTIESLPPALGLPAHWRPWATSQGVHVLILVLMLLGAFRSGV